MQATISFWANQLQTNSDPAEARGISIPWPTIRPMLGWQGYDGQILIDGHFLAENGGKNDDGVLALFGPLGKPPNQGTL